MTDGLERYLYHSHQGWPVYGIQTPTSITGEAMTHDPLCPMSNHCLREDYNHTERWAGDVCDWCEERCRCDLIAKVRKDMLAKCIDALQPFYIKGEVSPKALRAAALQEKP